MMEASRNIDEEAAESEQKKKSTRRNNYRNGAAVVTELEGHPSLPILLQHYRSRFRTARLTDFDRAVSDEEEFGSWIWLATHSTLVLDLPLLTTIIATRIHGYSTIGLGPRSVHRPWIDKVLSLAQTG
jgi:hypothetical protein